MVGDDAVEQLEDLLRDLDLLVFRLEQVPDGPRETLVTERGQVRREAEELRDRLQDILRRI